MCPAEDGQIAGPRVVEHMVDAVLSFEGEGSQQFRILRAIKNRFGPTDEIGVFEMTGSGLREVANPSELFLSERELGSPGTAVFAGMEGTRPLLVEIQALVAPTSLGTPRRAVVGWDPSRLSMVLAVLEAHCGVRLSGHDVYLNVAGGLRIAEPAADVAAAAALVSSLARASLPADAVYFGISDATTLRIRRTARPDGSSRPSQGHIRIRAASDVLRRLRLLGHRYLPAETSRTVDEYPGDRGLWHRHFAGHPRTRNPAHELPRVYDVVHPVAGAESTPTTPTSRSSNSIAGS